MIVALIIRWKYAKKERLLDGVSQNIFLFILKNISVAYFCDFFSGSVNDREFVPQNNSTLIEVPIQEFDKTNFDNNLHSYNVNEDVEMDTDENKVYKIPTISSRNVISPKAFAVNQSNYDNYPVFDDHKVEQDPMVNSVDFDGKKSPTRKISLDDRINMALLFQSMTYNLISIIINM